MKFNRLFKILNYTPEGYDCKDYETATAYIHEPERHENSARYWTFTFFPIARSCLNTELDSFSNTTST